MKLAISFNFQLRQHSSYLTSFELKNIRDYIKVVFLSTNQALCVCLTTPMESTFGGFCLQVCFAGHHNE